MEDKKTVKLWARVGVSMEVTQEELEAILQGNDESNKSLAQMYLLNILESGRCQLDGETYIPAAGNQEILKPGGDLSFDITPRPLHPKEKDFTIDTPHGTLHVYDKKDKEYPGIWVDLLHDDKDITLSMIEYIPGGESLCGFDPYHPEKALKERREVPESRRDGDEVTPGFVTRAWPDDCHDGDEHVRTFHTGYPLPRQQSLDEKIAQANDRQEAASPGPRETELEK